MRKHVNEYMKTGLANSGRIAGSGILYDKYNDDSTLDDHIRTGLPIKIAEREKAAKKEHDEYPVKTYKAITKCDYAAIANCHCCEHAGECAVRL